MLKFCSYYDLTILLARKSNRNSSHVKALLSNIGVSQNYQSVTDLLLYKEIKKKFNDNK